MGTKEASHGCADDMYRSTRQLVSMGLAGLGCCFAIPEP